MTQNYGELYHYGILNMKWGVRRYQNSDGSLTAAGKSRYAQNHKLKRQYISDKKNQYKNEGDSAIRAKNKANSAYEFLKNSNRQYDAANKRSNKIKEKIDKTDDLKKKVKLTNKFINSKVNEQVSKKHASNVDNYVDSYRAYKLGTMSSSYLFGLAGSVGYSTIDLLMPGGFNYNIRQEKKEERAKARKKYN